MNDSETKRLFDEHPFLQVLEEGEEGGDHWFVVANERLKRAWRIASRTWLEVEYDEMRSILVDGRDPRPIYTITRIVGYYSKTENWNRSKLAEREDRAKGDYQVKGERR